MSNELHYGIHEIRLSDDEDVAAVVERLSDPGQTIENVVAQSGVTHWLGVKGGVAVVGIDNSTRRPGSGRVVFTT